MLTPQQIIDSEYLDSRCALLEIAAVLDRYDIATERTKEAPTGNYDTAMDPNKEEPVNTEKLDCLRQAFALLAKQEPSTNRTEQLLYLFAKV